MWQSNVAEQSVKTTKIYVLHKITIALKFMSWFANSRKKAANPRLATIYKVGSTAWKRVAGNVVKVINSSNLVTLYVSFLQLQGYISL